MAYDLILEGPDDEREHALDRVRALPGAKGLELTPGSEEVLLTLHLRASDRDATVRRVYKALVELAVERGYQVFDPQVGAAVALAKPGKYPGGWSPELTVSEVRKMADKRHYRELQRELPRLRDANKVDKDGRTPLMLVLLSRAQGTTMKTHDASWVALQEVAIALLERGSEALLCDKNGAHALDHAVLMDHSLVVQHMLDALEPERRAEILATKLGGKTLLERALAYSALHSKATTKVLRQALAK